MIFTQFNFILILCSFGTIHARYNDTYGDVLTYDLQKRGDPKVTELFDALKESGTKLNDTESYKAAVQLLVELSQVLGTPSKEDFCDEYSFMHKNLDPFLNDVISTNLDLVTESAKTLKETVFDDEKTMTKVALTLALQSQKYLQNMPSTDQVKELMDIVEKIDVTADASYHQNLILKTIPEHVLRTIIVFFSFIKAGAPVIQESWNVDIDDIADIQRPWIIQSKNQTHLRSMFHKIKNLIEKRDKLDHITDEL